MCGIWAVLNYGKCTLKLAKSFERIKHRGPDSYKLERIPELPSSCIGFHRLAIIGDNQNMQPLVHPKFPHIKMVCNGEIYNHKLLEDYFELKLSFASDMECILHLYEKYGVKLMASSLDGMFAMILVDTYLKKAFLIRDAIGIRPLYFLRYPGNCIMASSEAKGLIDMALSSKCEIEVVMPGNIVEINLSRKGGAKVKEINSYYLLGQKLLHSKFNQSAKTENIFQNIRQLLKDAVKKRLQSHRKIGCLLSGGLDSSIVAGLICEIYKESSGEKNSPQLETFSVGMSEDGVDQIFANMVAKHLNTIHKECVFSFEDVIKELPNIIYSLESFDASSIRATIGLYFLCKFVKENSECVVLLTGEGSDELAFGYEHFHSIRDSEKSQIESTRLLKNMHYFDIRRSDSCISKWEMEGRVPFLDHQFLAYYYSLDSKLKQPKFGVEKWLLRKSFDLNEFLPNEVLWRKKIPFGMGLESNDNDLLEVRLNNYYDSMISDEEFEQGVLKYKFLPPKTKQEYQYRKYFEDFFPNQYSLCPQTWQ